MAHHVRELQDYQWSRLPLDPTVIRNLDEKTKKNVNGAGGGTWTPAAAITIGGAGVEVLGPAGTAGTGEGIVTSPGKHITLGRLDADDYIALDPGHADTSRALNGFVAPIAGDYGNVTQDGSPMLNDVSTRRTGVRFFSAPLRVHHGATLASFDLYWVVVAAHATIPEFRPRLRFVRVDKSGVVEPLRIDAATTDLDGFMFIGSNASAALYVASNGIQFATYTPNQTGKLVVDTSRYTYLAEIIEESGTNAVAGNRFANITTHVSTIAHLGPQ